MSKLGKPAASDAVEQIRKALQGQADVAGAELTPQRAAALRQCLQLCEDAMAGQPEPIRTVHHFACTGGTLIAKCLAVMPNVQLLSEIDPLSGYATPAKYLKFAPTDLITQMRQSTRKVNLELEIAIFQKGLLEIYADATARGQRLVLRDHSHSHFCSGDAIPERPTLKELVPREVPVVSLVTVRDPIDSFASLVSNKWLHFEPGNFDEYCRRYCAFLDRYQGVPVEKYEDFVSHPMESTQRMCAALGLAHRDDFQELFQMINITGDSGRSGTDIASRPRREVARELIDAALASSNYSVLTERLGYERLPVPAGPVAGA